MTNPKIQSYVNELVEKFYDKLTQIPYYNELFALRGVDIEVLKERQRTFIYKLAVGESLEHESGEIKQVQHRHNFQTDPEKAKLWLNTIIETIHEVDFPKEIQDTLVEKISFLTQKML